MPFSRRITSSWCTAFEADHFGGFRVDIAETLRKVLKDVVDSGASATVSDHIQSQIDKTTLPEALLHLDKMVKLAQDAIDSNQKTISRSIAPHVQKQLKENYETANSQHGRGSAARQRVRLGSSAYM